MRCILCVSLITAFLFFYPFCARAAVMTSEIMNGVPVTVWKTSSKASGYNNMSVIIFSHGFGGCSTQSQFLTGALADRGYLVIAPNHEDARCGEVYEERNNGFRTKIKSMFSGNKPDAARHFHGTPEKPFDKPEKWDEQTEKDRISDITEIINYITSEKRYVRMADAESIGVMGHSLGGYTAMAISGAWKVRKNTKIRAVVAFAPYIAPFVEKKSLADIDVPVMIQFGTKDSFTDAFPGSFDKAYDMMNIQKYYAVLDGADHFAWTDGVIDYQRVITAYTASFFDHYLRNNDTPLLFNRRGSGLAEYRSNMIRNSMKKTVKPNSSSGR